jgi:hypothetical protein
MVKNIIILFLALSLTSVALMAQGVTTAAINGKVTDNAGNALPGANVIATHVPSGTIFGTTTRGNGDYNLPNLRVGGPYTIAVSFVGFAKREYKDIYLQLSQNLRQDVRMVEEAVRAGEVLVTAERSAVMSAAHTGAATNVVREQIDRLPTISRNFQDYYKLSPYFSPSTATGTSGNALGRNSRYSNIQIDGANYNDLFGLGSTGAPAGQSNVTPISLDAIEEFQLVVSPYDVRQAGFTGAGINAVTRSGTNQYKGSVFVYGRNESMAGKDSGNIALQGFKDYQVGGRAGGPIIENILFLFANAEITRFSQPFTRTFGNAVLGTNALPVPADSLQMVTDTLVHKYGYDPGSFTNIGYNRESDKLFVRLDYNLAEGHRLTARWNYLRSSEDNSPSRGRAPTDIYFDNGKYKLDDKTHSIALQLSSVYGNAMSNEFILGYVDQSDIPTYYGSAFPTLYIATATPTATGTVAQNLVLGAEEFRHYNELGQKYFEITDNFTYYLGDHTFTLGAKVDIFKFRNLFIPDGFGAYTYSSILAFLKDQKASSYSFRYSATSNALQEANWGANQFGVYAQDEWVVNSALKLTAGLRVDIPTYPDKPNYNKAIDSTFHYRTDEPPKTMIAYSPRIGFNYSVDEERNMQVRGGVGIFYGRFPFVWVGNQYANTGVDFYTLGNQNIPAKFNPDPFNQAKPAASTLPSAEVDLTKSNFKAPSIIRWNLAVDHKLPYDLVATVEGIFSSTQNDVYYQNINLAGQQDALNVITGQGSLTPGGVLAGDGRPVWGKITSQAATAFTPVWINTLQFSPGVFLVRNTTQGSNANVTVQVQRTVPEGVNGTVAYTWGMAKDINSGNSTQAASGWRFNPTQGNPNSPQLTYSQWDRRHRILTALSYRQDWGDGLATTVGVFYNGQSGRPFSYMITGDVNGDGRSDNDLAYIPKDANDIVLMGVTDPTLPFHAVTNPNIKLTDKSRSEYSQLMAFIDADPYLKDNKGKISERSGPREPWAHQIDMRINQEIPTMPGHKVEISLDILNVLSLLKNSWGWIRNTGINQTVNMYTFSGLDKTAGVDFGKPRYLIQPSTVRVTDSVADPFLIDNILSRWQLQLGLRYTM